MVLINVPLGQSVLLSNFANLSTLCWIYTVEEKSLGKAMKQPNAENPDLLLSLLLWHREREKKM